jgi:hypothetical protein
MIDFRLLEPWEQPISCGAKRGPRGRMRCEVAALHAYGHHPIPFHTACDRLGRRYFW